MASRRRAMASAAAALLLAALAARAQSPVPPFTVQLNLVDCNTTAPSAAIAWRWNASGGPLVLERTGQCVVYDTKTTNINVGSCPPPGDTSQDLVLRADGTIFNAATGLCVDVQYYGNTTGSVLGLYTCYSGQAWDSFVYDASSGLLTTEGLCVSGGPFPPAIPTPQQIAWMDTEVSLMISFDMITMLTEVPNPQHFCIDAGGDSGFPVPPATRFTPSEAVFTDSWMQAATAAGAGYTLLVASHCSGFLQWQSNITLPDGSLYNYSVRQATSWRGGNGDVVDDYVASSRRAGLPFGFYLTWNYLYLFNHGPNGFAPTPLQPGQVSVTTEQYLAIVTASLEEVWSRYKGEIFEIWFDGGENNGPLNALIAELQPQAIVTDGTQGPNFARLVGQESGYAPYPTWSTTMGPAQDGSGVPGGPLFVPPEADTPVALNDAWFWKPNQQYRPFSELRAVYLNTVGANSLLELGVLPDNTGSIPSDQMAVLQAFGDYVRQCHSPAAAVASVNGTAGVSVTLPLPAGSVINRVILQEDLTHGQLVFGFTVEVATPGGYAPKPVLVAEGTAIGHKRILYFQSGPIPATSVIVTATSLYPGYTEAYWRTVAAYAPCAGDNQ